MNNIKHLQSELKKLIGEDKLQEIQQFLLVFSRFEFTLQSQGLVRNHKFADCRILSPLLVDKYRLDVITPSMPPSFRLSVMAIKNG